MKRFSGILLILSVFFFAACGGGGGDGGVTGNDPAVVGTWTLTTVDGEDVSSEGFTVVFGSDTYTFNAETCTEKGDYTTSDNTVTITTTSVTGCVAGEDCACGGDVGESDTMPYSVSGTTLTITDEDGSVLVLTKSS